MDLSSHCRSIITLSFESHKKSIDFLSTCHSYPFALYPNTKLTAPHKPLMPFQLHLPGTLQPLLTINRPSRAIGVCHSRPFQRHVPTSPKKPATHSGFIAVTLNSTAPPPLCAIQADLATGLSAAKTESLGISFQTHLHGHDRPHAAAKDHEGGDLVSGW